jgi:hypothetical protein
MTAFFNGLFLLSSVIPLIIGMGYLLKPRKVLRFQARFRKKIEQVEKKMYKYHKRVGAYSLVVSFLMIYTYFRPLWIYHTILIARMIFFPESFQATQPVKTTPMTCL